MGDEFYAAIKLVTGEEIFSLVSADDNNGDSLLILQNPVILKIINHNHGMYVKIKPWLELPGDDFFIIRHDKIITMTEIKNPMIINFYNKFLNDDITNDSEDLNNNQNSGEVKLSNKMGYISSVEDARKRLEEIYNGSNDIKEF